MSWQPMIEKIYQDGVLVSATIQRTPNGPKEPYQDEALAQPEQSTTCGEPVANVVLREGSPTLLRESDIKPTDERLYTTPPQGIYYTPPQRKQLTVEKLREHWQVAKVLDMTDAEIDFADYVLIARDVEALYGIKGEQC